MIPSLRPISEREPNLIWVASYPKSGNTWMRLFLHAYFGDGTVDINGINGEGSLGDMKRRFYHLPDDLGRYESFYFRTLALWRMANLEGDQLMKTHSCNGRVFGIEQIPREFTKGAIYIARDPRDIAISYADHQAVDIDRAITIMSREDGFSERNGLYQYMGKWCEHVESWLTPGLPSYPVLLIRYEDMLKDPEKEFRSVVKFMSPEVDDKKLKRAIEACSFANLRKQEDEKGFEEIFRQEKFFRSGKSTWREVLSSEQVERIEGVHGNIMEKLGYALTKNSDLRRRMLPGISALAV